MFARPWQSMPSVGALCAALPALGANPEFTAGHLDYRSY